MGVSITNNSEVLMRWYRMFREKRAFSIPPQWKHNLPAFLDLNPDVCDAIKKYALSNLSQLSCEYVSEYIHTVVLPEMVKDERKSNNQQDLSDGEVEKIILKRYELTNICISTVYRWLIKLGLKYEPRRKGYCVDGHEKADTKNYRHKFIERYFQYELRAFWRIQISQEEAHDLEQAGIIVKGSGYNYNKPETGLPMVEYHVETYELFQERMNAETTFGGKRSVRYKDGRMLIIWGHDEAIFKQYLLTKKGWVGPNSEIGLKPTDEGMGLMISAMQCCEFGFGLEMSREQLEKVNQFRQGKKYADEEAAKARQGSEYKTALTCRPFIIEFSYGVQEQGYWNYEHMVIQFEDCMDCLTTLYPEFDYLFLFDHSCGHDKQREDGLNVERMLKGFGGKQAVLHDTLIRQEQGYLGTYPQRLKPGDVQKMVFHNVDGSPFWMQPIERQQKKHDIIKSGMQKRKLTKAELLDCLKEKGIVTKGRVADLIVAAQNNGIPVEEEMQKIQEGWAGKPKGLLQVAYERGLIEEHDAWKRYTISGRKDNVGNLLPETFLKLVVGACTDFEEELTMLQMIGQKLGAVVDRTPKCHCEIAGEGIEYSLGLAKNQYRKILLENKRGKEKSIQSVRECISRTLISRTHVQKFSKRAHRYMQGYHVLKEMQQGNIKGSSLNTDQCSKTSDEKIVPKKLEQMVKHFKTHRCAMDFDYAYCKAIYNEI
jgi:hypothetical protein